MSHVYRSICREKLTIFSFAMFVQTLRLNFILKCLVSNNSNDGFLQKLTRCIGLIHVDAIFSWHCCCCKHVCKKDQPNCALWRSHKKRRIKHQKNGLLIFTLNATFQIFMFFFHFVHNPKSRRRSHFSQITTCSEWPFFSPGMRM